MSIWDDEAGYDRDDPKHPDYAELWLAHMDNVRKQEREGLLSEPGRAGRPPAGDVAPGSENKEEL